MSLIEIERRNAVSIVRFNNPPKGYMNAAMVGELDAAVDGLLADETVRVLVFTGALPGVFIEHYDVSELLALSRKLRARGASFSLDRPSPESGFHKILTRLEAASKPAIAAITLCGVSLHQVSPVVEGACTRAIMVAKKSGACAVSAGRFWLLRNAASADER